VVEHHRLVDKRDPHRIHWAKKAFFKALDFTLSIFSDSDPKVIVGDSEGLVKAVDKTWDAAREKGIPPRMGRTFSSILPRSFLSAADLSRV